MPWITDFILQRQLQLAMQKNWAHILKSTDKPYFSEEKAFFEERIDATADILLQIIKQTGYQ